MTGSRLSVLRRHEYTRLTVSHPISLYSGFAPLLCRSSLCMPEQLFLIGEVIF